MFCGGMQKVLDIAFRRLYVSYIPVKWDEMSRFVEQNLYGTQKVNFVRRSMFKIPVLCQCVSKHRIHVLLRKYYKAS